MKKSKTSKKEDVVEVSKSAFKNTRQTGKSLTNAEVIKKVIGDDVVKVADDDDVDYNRNPDSDSDSERMESIDTVSEENVTSDEEAIQIFRDVLSMSDDDRNSDSGDNRAAPVRLMPPPPPTWTDNPDNIKYKVGEFVRYKGNPSGSSYKVCGQGKEQNTYELKGSKSRDTFKEIGDKLVKISEKDAKWVDYWSQFPVIPAPKPWLKKEEPKPVKAVKRKK